MNITKRKSSIAWKVLALICCMAGALPAGALPAVNQTGGLNPGGTIGSIRTTGTSGLFTYADDGTSITIIDYPTSAVGVVDIPATIIGKPVTAIGSGAFYSCSGLTSVTIPVGVTSIGDAAFYSCTGLTGITIPSGVTSIGQNAFYYCTGLTGVTIPAGVTSIGIGAFMSCAGLTSITVDPLNAAYSGLDGLLFDKNQTTLIQCPGGKAGFTIPASVTTIGSYAFYAHSHLTGIAIPAGVTTIGNDAFAGCLNLTSVTIPTGVTGMGDRAFSSCTGLTDLIISEGVPSIGYCVFYNCTGLTSVTIPASVTSIGMLAFSGCSSLTGAYFPGNAPSTGIYAFGHTASSFQVYYFNGTGFTSPSWYGYPSVNLGASTPSANWLLSNNLPYNANLQTDPDGDGVSLLMAYALNLDPARNLSNSMPKPVLAANQMSMTFYAGTAGVSYTVQTSTDLQNWSAAGVVLSAPDGNNRRTATIPATGPQRYMRLVASY